MTFSAVFSELLYIKQLEANHDMNMYIFVKIAYGKMACLQITAHK